MEKLLFTPPLKQFTAIFWMDGDIHERNFDTHKEVSENEEEWVYSVQDIVPTLEKLTVGETIHFQADRGNENTRGFIVRLS